MKFNALILILLLFCSNAFPDDEPLLSSVNIDISYNRIIGGVIRNSGECDSSCYEITKLQATLKDFDLIFWQNVLKSTRYNETPDLIGRTMCGGPSIKWKITLVFKNKSKIVLYTDNEIQSFKSNMLIYLNDSKNRTILLYDKLHYQLIDKLKKMFQDGLNFKVDEIDCGF